MLLLLIQPLLDRLNVFILLYWIVTLVLLSFIGLILIVQNGNVSKTRKQLRQLRRFGIHASNMADKYDPKYDAPDTENLDGPVYIKAMYIYPVKSCGYIEVDRALLTKTGFLYDRCFAFATELLNTEHGTGPKWRFISQRTKPKMSLIKSELWLPHGGSQSQTSLVQSGGCVVLTFPDPDVSDWTNWVEACVHSWSFSARPEISFIVPLKPTPEQMKEYNIGFQPFGIHHREANGLDMGNIPAVAAAIPKLKKFLQIPERQNLTLLRCTPDTLTRTDRNLAPLKYIGSPSVHGYTDQQPININSLSSVHAVSALLPPENQPLNPSRFRANVWITGAPAYAEERWKRYRIIPKIATNRLRADIQPTLSVVCRTSRCTMPNVDPDTGKFDTDNPAPEKKKGKPQPSTTLVKHRTVENGNKMALGYIGMHCVPEDWSLEEAQKQGIELYIHVGDEIEVLEEGEHLYGSTGNDY